MKLITELSEDIEYLTEAKETGEKQHYIHGKFLVGDKENKNKRIYPSSVLSKEVERYIKELVEEKRAYGELGHPSGPQINLDRVSHIITELKRDGSDFIGKALITDTPMGNIAKGLLKSGAKLGVSSRGTGSLKPNKHGIMEVQGDFRLATAGDIVADPSAPGAYVNGVMENVEWVYDPVKNTWYEEKLHNIKKMSSRSLEEHKLRLFEDYISFLTSKN